LEITAFPVTPFATNCLVLREGAEALVVDPGDVPRALAEHLAGTTVKAIVNTHGHCDHCGGNAALKAMTGAELACHEKELALLRAIVQQGAMFGMPFPPSPDPDRLLEEGDVLEVGGSRLEVLLTPGHSPGHIVLLGDGFVLAGDTLFAGSIGRTDLPGGNHDELLKSIQTRLLCLPDATQVYSGHGPVTTIGEERSTNPYLVEL
jgi:hydroxyacylglutathione hydrolase